MERKDICGTGYKFRYQYLRLDTVPANHKRYYLFSLGSL